jgi:nucleoside-diphosphate-sugar epimerase
VGRPNSLRSLFVFLVFFVANVLSSSLRLLSLRGQKLRLGICQALVSISGSPLMSSLHGKRLVIFGCGYIGSAVAEVASMAGAQVEALTRNHRKAETLRTAGLAKVVVSDLASSDWHGQLENGPDFVVNTVSSGGPENYHRSYVGGMQSILAWASASSAPVGTLVYTSSTSVYPQGTGAVVDENAAAPGATPNGAIIRESESLLVNAPARACARWFILRLAGIYGPGRHHLLDQLRSGAGTLPGEGSHRLNLAHRDDIVAVILACLQAPASVGREIFNVSDTAPALRSEVVAWLAEKLGRPVPSFDGSPAVRRSGVSMPDRIISHGKIQRLLGWRPRYPDYRAGYGAILGSGR